MSEKLVLIPGPDHPISVTPSETHVSVSFGGQVIAETDDALVLQEADYPPAYYLPLDAVDPAVLESTTHATYCPYKGDASYYTLRSGENVAENAVWSYVKPYDSVAGIAGHVAFYPDQVELTTR